MQQRDHTPIGIFDSGIGGWSVLREIRRALPRESLLYLADSAYAPYGERSEADVMARALAVAGQLVARGAKSLVVACNTATVAAVATLRSRLNLPIVAIEPAVKPAAALTTTGIVGVLATRGTIDSARLARLRDEHGRDVRILTRAVTGLVERIEAGDFDGAATRSLVERHVMPLREAGADVLVLGCTHFPLIHATIASIAGPAMQLIDPAPAVARELKRRLEHAHLLADGGAHIRVLTTGSVARMREQLAMLGDAGLEPETVCVD